MIVQGMTQILPLLSSHTINLDISLSNNMKDLLARSLNYLNQYTLLTNHTMNTTKTIIIVEDNPAEAKLAEFAFKELAIPNTILIFSEGIKFLEYLEDKGPDQIAFVLLDLNLPAMNGKEILQNISGNVRYRSLPTLVFSSSGFEDEIEECYDLGAKAYIRKPMDYLRFKEILDATYNFWVGQNIQPGRLAV